MKRNKTKQGPLRPTEDEIRDYAYHLYCQAGSQGGHDLDNWLEAEACLCSNVPKECTHLRLHGHLQGKKAA